MDSVELQFVDEGRVWNFVKGLCEVEEDGFSYLASIVGFSKTFHEG